MIVCCGLLISAHKVTDKLDKCDILTLLSILVTMSMLVSENFTDPSKDNDNVTLMHTTEQHYTDNNNKLISSL